MILKNNKKDIWKSINNAFYFAAAFSVYIIFNTSIPDKMYFIKFFTVSYLIFLAPALYLLFEYISKNKGNEITINNNSICLKSKEKADKIYSMNEINYIIFAKPANLDEYVYIPFTIHETFHFIKIVFNNGDAIFITSIMKYDNNEIIKLFDQNKVIRVKSMFSSLNRSFSTYVKRYFKSLELDEIFEKGKRKRMDKDHNLLEN